MKELSKSMGTLLEAMAWELGDELAEDLRGIKRDCVEVFAKAWEGWDKTQPLRLFMGVAPFDVLDNSGEECCLVMTISVHPPDKDMETIWDDFFGETKEKE